MEIPRKKMRVTHKVQKALGKEGGAWRNYPKVKKNEKGRPEEVKQWKSPKKKNLNHER